MAAAAAPALIPSSAQLLACPICALPCFESVDALRSKLVSAATRSLPCPACPEVLQGLDKLTIHLFGHSLLQEPQQRNPQQVNPQQVNPQQVNPQQVNSQQVNPQQVNPHQVNSQQANSQPPQVASSGASSGAENVAERPIDTQTLEQTHAQDEVERVCAEVRRQLLAEQAQRRLAQHIRQLSQRAQNAQKQAHLLAQQQQLLQHQTLQQQHREKEERSRTECTKNFQETRKDQLDAQILAQAAQSLTEDDRQTVFKIELQHPLPGQCNNAQHQGQHSSQVQEVHQKQGHQSNSQLKSKKERQDNDKHQILLEQHIKRQLELQEQHNLQQHIQQQHHQLMLQQKHQEQQQQEQHLQQQQQQEQVQLQQRQQQHQQRQQQQQQQQQQQRQLQNQLQQLHQQQLYQQEQQQQQSLQQTSHRQSQQKKQQKLEHQELPTQRKEQSVTEEQQQQLKEQFEQLERTHAFAEQLHENRPTSQANKPGFPCHLCTKAFKMRGSLMVHLRVAHSGLDTGKILRSWVESAQQLQNGPDSKAFSCQTCGKSFKKEQQLTQHQKTHEGKQWECDVCSKLFTTKYFLKKHKRLHTGEMPYKCPTCEKTFTFQQSYHKHLLYHSDEKPHVCTECDRAFKELSTLHNHQRIHTGEKPFACETCGKCFRQRVSYLVHRRIHTGAMPYRCTACGKSFRYKVSQRTHKCPAQPPGTVVRHSGELVQRLLEGLEGSQGKASLGSASGAAPGSDSGSTPATMPGTVPGTMSVAVMEAAPGLAQGIARGTIPTLAATEEIIRISKNCSPKSILPKQEMENTAVEITPPGDVHVLPQPSNQFIILLESNVQQGLPPGFLVTAPPLMMLSSEANIRNVTSQWPAVGALTDIPPVCQTNPIKHKSDPSLPEESTEIIMKEHCKDSINTQNDPEKTKEEIHAQSDLNIKQSETQDTNVSNEVWFHSSPDTVLSHIDTNKIGALSNSPDLGVQTTDFFTMVMSPQQIPSLPSPSEALRQLTLSSPEISENQDHSSTLLQFYIPSVASHSNHSSSTKLIPEPNQIPESTSDLPSLNISESKSDYIKLQDTSISVHSDLQTINEESLKQLLYGTSS